MKFASALAFVGFASLPALAQSTWYVDAAAPGPGTGTQADPYASLQAAIDAPMTLPGDTLLVATGTYQESVDLRGKDLIVDGGAATPAPRIDALGLGTALSFTQGETAACVVRGFVVTGGTGTNLASTIYGGGVFVHGASPTLEAMVIQDNEADTGGGMAVLSGGAVMLDCEWADNDSQEGGGLYVENATVTVVGGRFLRNEAEPRTNAAYGGGMYVGVGADVHLEGSLFSRNESQAGGGGGLYAAPGSVATLVQGCAFEYNAPGKYAGPGFGGGVYARGPLRAIDCDFFRNGTTTFDGVYAGGGAYGGEYEDCRFIENEGQLGGGLSLGQATDCYFERNVGCADGSGQGGGATNSTLTRCQLVRNYTCGDGGGAFNSTLLDCEVLFNFAGATESSPGSGGGLASGTATRTLIQGNRSAGPYGIGFPSTGGGASSADLVQCTVVGNFSETAGGVRGGSTDRCSIVGNFAEFLYGGVSSGQHSSSIVWHNTPATIGGNATFEYSNVGPLLPPGTGNLSLDPMLESASGADVHLLVGSPCIDAGSPMAPLDADGSIADMGSESFDSFWVTGPASYCHPTRTIFGGCFATLSASGPASMSMGVTIQAIDMPPQSFGLFFLGDEPNAELVFGSGSLFPNALCVGGQITRTAVVMSSDGPGPCDGVLTKDVTPADFLAAGGQPGGTLFGQLWFRQPGSSQQFPRTAMSNAIYLPLAP